MIVANKTGKTMLLKDIANAIAMIIRSFIID
jgi:transcription termination factor Rho